MVHVLREPSQGCDRPGSWVSILLGASRTRVWPPAGVGPPPRGGASECWLGPAAAQAWMPRGPGQWRTWPEVMELWTPETATQHAAAGARAVDTGPPSWWPRDHECTPSPSRRGGGSGSPARDRSKLPPSKTATRLISTEKGAPIPQGPRLVSGSGGRARRGGLHLCQGPEAHPKKAQS